MNKFRAYFKSPTSNSREKVKGIGSDVGHEKEATCEKHAEKPRVDLEIVIKTNELKKNVAGRLGKKSREVKCFKCQGYGHIAS